MESNVSLVRYTSSPESLREAITLCEGFSDLRRDHCVLIKPNLGLWKENISVAAYGVYTTTRLIEDILICLKDFGCNKITIGEGSVEFSKGIGTMKAFEGLGYKELEKRYGIELVDFNQSESARFTFHEDKKLHIAKEAIEQDFFINVPVLKTHGQTKVSLGLKNLKGCLKLGSKKLCHNAELDLEYCFSFIEDYIQSSLTIVDGIYALEKGASHFGNAYRKNIIVASKDTLLADMLAAKTIGFDPEDIEHFVYYAKRHDRSLDLNDYEILGEKIENHILPLEWDWSWNNDNTGPKMFDNLGIVGPALRKYDDSLCSGCSFYANMCNILIMSAFNGKPLPNVEILNGKRMQASPGYERTILLGNCMIKANMDNKHIKKAIEVKGCPPEEREIINAFKSIGYEINETVYKNYLNQQSNKYNRKEKYDKNFFLA